MPAANIQHRCPTCGQPAAIPGRCTECLFEARAKRRALNAMLGADHRELAAQTLAEEKTCHRCGHPGTPSDPLVADHVQERVNGGVNTRANYRAAHRSCNSSAGASISTGGWGVKS